MLAGGGRLTSHCSSNESQLLATLPADSHGASPENLLHEWLTFTLPNETNSHLAPERWLEDETRHLNLGARKAGHSQGRTLSFREGIVS